MRSAILVPFLMAMLCVPLAHAESEDTPLVPQPQVEEESTTQAVMGWFADKGAYVMKKGKAAGAAMAHDDPYHHQLELNKSLRIAEYEYRRRISELETELAVTQKMEPNPDEYIVQEAAGFCAKVLEDAYAIRRSE